ncbi:hypothetical protein D3C79_358090 [compost metagenome]
MSDIIKQVSTMKKVIVVIMVFLPSLFWDVQIVKVRAMYLKNGMTTQGNWVFILFIRPAVSFFPAIYT